MADINLKLLIYYHKFHKRTHLDVGCHYLTCPDIVPQIQEAGFAPLAGHSLLLRILAQSVCRAAQVIFSCLRSRDAAVSPGIVTTGCWAAARIRLSTWRHLTSVEIFQIGTFG